MGTMADDAARRREHERLNRDPALRAALEAARQRTEAKARDARRSRLHTFGLPGGRRSRGE